ncbi:MAG: hypothetical protein V4580_17015 [Bacteroidota bacterium]
MYKFILKSAIVILLVTNLCGFIQQAQMFIGQAPKGLPLIDSAATGLTWRILVNEHFGYLNNPGLYSDENDSLNYSARVLTGAMFGAVYGWYPATGKRMRDPATKKRLTNQFYQSEAQQKILYNWIKPYYIEAYKKQPAWKKKIYADMLTRIETYLAGFNYAKELKTLHAYPGSTIEKAPVKSAYGNFAKAEQFIFRRIYYKDMTLEQLRKWAKIIRKDFDAIQ